MRISSLRSSQSLTTRHLRQLSLATFSHAEWHRHSIGDRGYDAEAIRQGLRDRRIIPFLAMSTKRVRRILSRFDGANAVLQGERGRPRSRPDCVLAGKANFHPAKLGSKRHLICDGRGIPLALQLTGANRTDSQQISWIRSRLAPPKTARIELPSTTARDPSICP